MLADYHGLNATLSTIEMLSHPIEDTWLTATCIRLPNKSHVCLALVKCVSRQALLKESKVDSQHVFKGEEATHALLI